MRLPAQLDLALGQRLPLRYNVTLLLGGIIVKLPRCSLRLLSRCLMRFHPFAVMAGGVPLGSVAGEVDRAGYEDEAGEDQPAKINRDSSHSSSSPWIGI